MLRSLKYGLYGAVLAGIVGGLVAWSSIDKTVTLEVDGSTTQIHTVAATVGGVLGAAGYQIGPHDLIAPQPSAPVRNGSVVVLKRGRLLELSIDGHQRDVWVTDTTVAQALADLGFPTVDFASVSRSQRLPLTPTTIDIRAPKHVKLITSGKAHLITTTDATVGQLLSQLGITLTKYDKTVPSVGSAITNGQTITVVRISRSDVWKYVPIPFGVKQIQDAALTQGQVQVVTAGRWGEQLVIYATVYVNGVPTGQTVLSSTVLTPPFTQVEKVGTKPIPVTVIHVDPGTAQAIAQQMLAARGWGADQFSCLLTLWGHESGWRVNASNPDGAYGIPQALPGSKMSAYGADWQTDPTTQIAWGLAYISGRYGTPCGAWSSWQANGWY